ncbi:MAG TPA: phosphatidylserine decarboxylase, partial [Gammaproteobacteria bacterium]|nr:phosphatidylserine decarboxylase [Gammaproteobacteria bacterium]
AMNVASIETVWAGEITPPMGRRVQAWDYKPRETSLEKGAEAGRFNMGSTVILLFAKDRVRWEPEYRPGAAVRMGRKLATRL